MSRGSDPVKHARSDISAMRSAIRWLEARRLGDYSAILKRRQYREYQQLFMMSLRQGWRPTLANFRECVDDLHAVWAVRAFMSSLFAFRSG